MATGWDVEEEREEGRLPYGIRPRVVYYVCLKCGRRIAKEELESRPAYSCPHCGYRVFVKERPPASNIGVLRRVYAV